MDKTLVSFLNPAIKHLKFPSSSLHHFQIHKIAQTSPPLFSMHHTVPARCSCFQIPRPGPDRTDHTMAVSVTIRSGHVSSCPRMTRSHKKKRESNTRDEPRLEGLDGLRASSEFLACLVSCDKILRARVRL